MFFHNFCYFLKILTKNKGLVFWTLGFPLILATFFNMAFSDIEKTEKFNVMNIAVVNNEEFNNNIIFKSAISSLSDDSNKDRLFDTKYVEYEEAVKLLDEKEIIGYLYFTDKPSIVINSNGVYESIFKSVVEELYQLDNLVDKNNPNLFEEYSRIMTKYSMEVKYANTSSSNLSYTMIEFYTLIAMTALYGGILSLYVINQILPNISSKGKRVSVSPVSKFKLLISGLTASYIVQLVGLLLLYLYTIFVLNIDYGNNILLIVLLTLVGALAGLSLGMVVSLLFKTNENAKTGILISVTMLFSFLSGMMGITMKYVIDKNIPIINKLNPVNMITDGLYSLYYYDTYNRYYFNIISLLIFSFVLIFISYLILRRQKYDSI